MDNGLVCCDALASVAAMAKTRPLPDQVDRNKQEQDALYDMHAQTHGWVKKIAAVQRKHGHQLDAIEHRLGTVEGQLGTIKATQDKHGGKLDEILGILKEP